MLASSTFLGNLFAMKVRKPYHHGALRQALISEAFKALETEGVEGVTLRGLAASAGVSKTAPYRHFEDKHALLVTLAAEGFRQLADALEQALRAPAPAASEATGAIRSLLRAYLDFARSRPALYRLMVSRLGFSLHSESCRINSERAFSCLVQAVDNAQRSGWRAGQDAMSLVLSLWAEVHGWAGLLIDELLPGEFKATPEAVTVATEALLD